MDATIQQQTPPGTAQAEPTEQQEEPVLIPSDTTPEEFYAEITKRADVRAILEELAKDS